MAKKIMIQGTMSNSGKSFLTAALCRIFYQDGLRAAPFKSQNMALNSFVTAEGAEIGRAQAMQAEAAGIAPTADMNPILLKPTGQMKSQVIVNGRVFGDMSAMDYYRRKTEMIPVIRAAFARLERAFDVIVIEGAGSPAEINLRENDIVNMGLAELVDAPVLLVGDIDRGGVFASLYGTVELLRPQERKRVRGLIINKFRGDQKILEPGLKMIEDLVHIPVLGVVPMSEIDIDDEDSLSDRLETKSPTGDEELTDIAVIRLPHISNFTDFLPLSRIEGVSLRYVGRPEELGRPDLIILPGTKTTSADLDWLLSCGLAEQICRLSGQERVPVMGICGGFQMLCGELNDPDGVEAPEKPVRAGLGLLQAVTFFAKEKTQRQTAARLAGGPGLLSGMAGLSVTGYEIHMGVTRARPGQPVSDFLRPAAGQAAGGLGLVRGDGLVIGTYLHGLFDNVNFTEALLKNLAARRGARPVKMESQRAYRERQYDALAALVRGSLDMEAVRRILNGDSGPC